MTADGWKLSILHAITQWVEHDDETAINTLAAYLEEVDNARQALRDKGYGVTGTPVERQVEEVPARHA